MNLLFIQAKSYLLNCFSRSVPRESRLAMCLIHIETEILLNTFKWQRTYKMPLVDSTEELSTKSVG